MPQWVIYLLILLGLVAVAFGIGFYIGKRKRVGEKEMILANRPSLEDLFVTLEFILTTEFALYEKFLFNNTNTDLTSITNTEFENFYQDLSDKCLKSISPTFWAMVEVYMKRDSVATYITQRVYNYLADKVQE